MVAHRFRTVNNFEAFLTVQRSILAILTTKSSISFLALCALARRSCAACALKLVHTGLIRLWFALHWHRRHDSTAANRAEVLQWSQSARHAHGVVPSWGQQRCVDLGVELVVAENTAQLAREAGRISTSLRGFREWFLRYSTRV